MRHKNNNTYYRVLQHPLMNAKLIFLYIMKSDGKCGENLKMIEYWSSSNFDT